MELRLDDDRNTSPTKESGRKARNLGCTMEGGTPEFRYLGG